MIFNRRKLGELILRVKDRTGGRWSRKSGDLEAWLEGVVEDALIKAAKQAPRAKTLRPPIAIPPELRPAKRMRRGLLR